MVQAPDETSAYARHSLVGCAQDFFRRMKVAMKVLQIVTSREHDCGIAVFAENLEFQMQSVGVKMLTARDIIPQFQADVVLLHYHEELFSDAALLSLRQSCSTPIVLFAHSEIRSEMCEIFQGFAGMHPGMVPAAEKPNHVFPHPAWTPPRLEDRRELRREFKLPEDRIVVGANGFLKFERQFVEIARALLPEARRNNWFVDLMVSPWRLESPGLIPALEELQNYFRDWFRSGYL